MSDEIEVDIFKRVPTIKEITKQDFERFIVNFNEILSCYEHDNYKSKQHLIDRLDKYCDAWITEYDLNIEDTSNRTKGAHQ